MKVQDYICEKLPLTLRENKKDDGTLIGLPYPYTVPCADGIFNELYYWDTYFTNKALFAVRNAEQVRRAHGRRRLQGDGGHRVVGESVSRIAERVCILDDETGFGKRAQSLRYGRGRRELFRFL